MESNLPLFLLNRLDLLVNKDMYRVNLGPANTLEQPQKSVRDSLHVFLNFDVILRNILD